jgi:transcriptional regulator with XRE-family HTH domain
MARQKRTDGYGERLRMALEVGPRPMGVRQLARAVSDAHPELRGASYGGVRQYVEGNIRNPRAELLRALAGALGVRPEWLAYNEGAMTAAEEAERKRPAITPDPGQIQRTRAAVFAAFNQETPGLKAVGIATDRFVLPAVQEVAYHVNLNQPGIEDEPAGEQTGHRRYVEAARILGRAVMAPLKALGLEPEYWPQGEKAHYLAHMLPLLTTLAELEHGIGAAVRGRQDYKLDTREGDNAED